MFHKIYAKEMADVDYKMIFDFIATYINEDDYILDAGCGPGYLLKELIDKKYQAIGVDNDLSMLDFAVNELDLFGKVFYHDLNDDFGNTFDIIVSIFDVVNYFKDVDSYFNNVYKALNDNGKFIFDIYNNEYVESINNYSETIGDYLWSIKVLDYQIIHKIKDNKETLDELIQYGYDLTYYKEKLEGIGFFVETIKGPDKRKDYIIAKK